MSDSTAYLVLGGIVCFILGYFAGRTPGPKRHTG